MTISDEIVRELSNVRFDGETMVLDFRDGGTATVPLWWYPRLADATSQQRQIFQLSGNGRGIYWPDIDEDLNINAILSGVKSPQAHPPLQAAE